MRERACVRVIMCARERNRERERERERVILSSDNVRWGKA